MIPIIITTLSIVILTGIFVKLFFKRKHTLIGKHVFITGGSKGIGKSFVIECIKLGANVSIIARDEDVLEQLKIDLLKNHVNRYGSINDQKIMTVALDVTSDYYNIEKAIEDTESVLGPIYMLINCAGTSISARFDDTNLDDFHRMMDINYFGSVKVSKAVINSMKLRIADEEKSANEKKSTNGKKSTNEKKSVDEKKLIDEKSADESSNGVIIFVSSISGLLGLYGYSAYSGSKFALVGLAEVLSMELKSFGINVCVSFPPDTDTPGFEEENKSKPKETRMISESGGLFQPDVVAVAALNDALSGKFASTVGMESLMVRTVCAGMMPVASVFELMFQMVTMPIFRLISVIFLNSCHKIIQKCKREESKNQISQSNEEDE